MAKIKYKGKKVEAKIDNRAMMKFELNGGTIGQFETQPITASINLACACLGLEGDPLDHANDLPNLNELPAIMRDIIEESGLNKTEDEEVDSKKENG
jgi:hypothetical protein|tara:strand:- start:6940 stop:7230 length:291 start_codon:yes stop_codon:yes gene_type:complete